MGATWVQWPVVLLCSFLSEGPACLYSSKKIASLVRPFQGNVPNESGAYKERLRRVRNVHKVWDPGAICRIKVCDGEHYGGRAVLHACHGDHHQRRLHLLGSCSLCKKLLAVPKKWAGPSQLAWSGAKPRGPVVERLVAYGPSERNIHCAARVSMLCNRAARELAVQDNEVRLVHFR